MNDGVSIRCDICQERYKMVDTCWKCVNEKRERLYKEGWAVNEFLIVCDKCCTCEESVKSDVARG